jgi:hypothetical protein
VTDAYLLGLAIRRGGVLATRIKVSLRSRIPGRLNGKRWNGSSEDCRNQLASSIANAELAVAFARVCQEHGSLGIVAQTGSLRYRRAGSLRSVEWN